MASPEFLFRHRSEYLGSNYSLTFIKEVSEHKYGFSGKQGVRSVENEECGKRGVWKMSSVENRGVENAECGKFVENFSFPFQYEINK